MTAEHGRARSRRSEQDEGLGQQPGALAHDLNNLIAVILNYAALADLEMSASSERCDDDRWVVARSDVSRILVAAERAARLTHDLLAFARPDAAVEQVINLDDVITGLGPLLADDRGSNRAGHDPHTGSLVDRRELRPTRASVRQPGGERAPTACPVAEH